MAIRWKGRDHTRQFHPLDRRSCRLECACAATGLLFFLPLVSAPESRFGRFWANQGLIVLLIQVALVILWLVVGGFLWLLSLIPFLGILFSILRVAVGILLIAVALTYVSYAMTYAIKGRAKDVPVFGHMRLLR